VETTESKFPELLNFFDEMPHIDRASRVSLDTIQKTLKQMDSNIRNLQTDINNNRVPQSGDDKFLEVMEVRNYCDNCHFWPVKIMSDVMCCDSA
jgi:hypothetical protein